VLCYVYPVVVLKVVEGLNMEIFVLVIYFFPAIVAGVRSHHSAGAIFVLNLLLGWTVLGWVVALVWGFASVKENKINVLQQGEVVGSVADEIRKLADLKNDGHLTDEEFNFRKREVLKRR